MSDVIVKNSITHGYGVFAGRHFAAGEVVVPWVAEKIVEAEEAVLLSSQEQEYMSRMDDGRYVIFAAPARYVNHSCNPNTTAKDNANIAARDIREGEEITTDYDDEGALGCFECDCGEPTCRKRIGADCDN